MRVVSKVGNLPSKCGHARPLVLELFTMYATDRRTDKSNTYCPLPYGGGGIKGFIHIRTYSINHRMLGIDIILKQQYNEGIHCEKKLARLLFDYGIVNTTEMIVINKFRPS